MSEITLAVKVNCGNVNQNECGLCQFVVVGNFAYFCNAFLNEEGLNTRLTRDAAIPDQKPPPLRCAKCLASEIK